MSKLAPYVMVDDSGVELGKPCRLRGNIVVFEKVGQRMTIDDDHPSIYGEHLLGYEGDEGRVYYFRAATDKEKEIVRAEEERKAAKNARWKDLNGRVWAAKKKFWDTGERPKNMRVTLEGDILLDTQNIYGGGDWFVISADRIWYVKNNGADEDNWAENNINTGGAGAIGMFLPREEPLEAEIRRFEEEVKELRELYG
jgi:hypothetical protein